MEIVYDEADLRFATSRQRSAYSNDAPVLLDHFLDDAEVDVDAICDGEMVPIGGIMEQTAGGRALR